jgi:metallo-beta-lactamase family protein
VVHHLKAFAPNPKNTVLFVGFQAAGTRGSAMLDGAESIKIHGQYIPVHADVEFVSNLSAHADYAEILAWLGGFESAPKTTFITHGEPVAADALVEKGVGPIGLTASEVILEARNVLNVLNSA